MKIFTIGLIVGSLAACGAASAADTVPIYKMTAAIPLGGGERWDYITYDPLTKRAYVAHGDEVTVVDTGTRQIVGHIGPLPGGTHGIALSPLTHTGFTDDGKAGAASVFDPATLKISATIPTALDADGIIYDPFSKHIFVINGDSGSITAIDPVSNKAVATIAAGAGLEFGVSDGHGHLYVDGVEKNEILAISTKTNTIEAHWPMPTCTSPHGLAIDTKARRLFATCSNTAMVVVNADTGANLASLQIGRFSDGAAFDPIRKLAFSSNGDGTLSVVQEKDAQTFVLLGNVQTVPSARTMAIDPQTGRLFLVGADIAKIDPPIQPGGRPHVTFVPGSTKLLIFDPS